MHVHSTLKTVLLYLKILCWYSSQRDISVKYSPPHTFPKLTGDLTWFSSQKYQSQITQNTIYFVARVHADTTRCIIRCISTVHRGAARYALTTQHNHHKCRILQAVCATRSSCVSHAHSAEQLAWFMHGAGTANDTSCMYVCMISCDKMRNTCICIDFYVNGIVTFSCIQSLWGNGISVFQACWNGS